MTDVNRTVTNFVKQAKESVKTEDQKSTHAKIQRQKQNGKVVQAPKMDQVRIQL
jgi:hypothetical protein